MKATLPYDPYILYECILHSIQTGSGIGLHNADPGHPIYLNGAYGDYDQLGMDGPDQNKLFQTLRALSDELGDEIEPRIENWQDFCKLVYDHRNQSSR